MAFEVSSVPLSDTIIAGLPQTATRRSSTRTIRLPGRDVSISTPKPRRVNWSSTLNTRKAATALQRVRHEVEHPDRIGASRFLERRSAANRTLTSAAATHFQALLTIEPPDLLQVHDDAAPTRHLTKATVPEATSLGSELLQKSPLGIVTPTLLLGTHR